MASSYRGIEPPERIDLYRYQNGEITIRVRREAHTGTGPPWNSHKTGTRLEDKARQRLAAFLKQQKITDVDPATVPLVASATPRPSQAKTTPWGGGKASLPAVIPAAGKTGLTEGERRAYKNGYQAAAYHRGKNGAGKVKAPNNMTRDLVGALAGQLNVSAVMLRLLQDLTGDPTSD